MLAPRALFVVLEAAVGTADARLAGAALEELRTMQAELAEPWRGGVLARVAAKLATVPDEAEAHFRDALALFTAAGSEPEVARTHLEYGEWLRRQRHRARALMHLRTAWGLFGDTGHPLRERAAREIALASGEPGSASGMTLTAQELAVARLAASGARNSEIGDQLFLSRHTVDYHLRKVFQKLGLSSRRDLGAALAVVEDLTSEDPTAPPER